MRFKFLGILSAFIFVTFVLSVLQIFVFLSKNRKKITMEIKNFNEKTSIKPNQEIFNHNREKIVEKKIINENFNQYSFCSDDIQKFNEIQFDEKIIKNYEFSTEGKTGILMITGWRPDTLKQSLCSLELLRNITDDFVFISSHDKFDELSFKLIKSIKFFKGDSFQIKNYYHDIYTELFSKKYQGRNTVVYNTISLKLHFLFAMKFVFDVLKLSKVIYLEDDVIVTPDLLLAVNELEKNKMRLCDDECVLYLGSKKIPSVKSILDNPGILGKVHFTDMGSFGSVLPRSFFNLIKKEINSFCNVSIPDWDLTFKHMSVKGIFSMRALTLDYPRCFHMYINPIRNENRESVKSTPEKERKKLMNDFRTIGLFDENYKTNLSKIRKDDKGLKGYKQNYEKWNLCKTYYSHLCSIISKEKLIIKEMKQVNEKMYFPVFDVKLETNKIDTTCKCDCMGIK